MMRKSFIFYFTIIVCLFYIINLYAIESKNCSEYQGKIVINELFAGGGGMGNLQFIELYVFEETNINNWNLNYNSKGKGNDFSINLTGYSPATQGEYIVLENIKLQDNSGEVLLEDSEGKVVDYLYYGDLKKQQKWNVNSKCSSSLPEHHPSNKDIARLPNGSGDFTDNDNNVTKGYNNNGTMPGSDLDHIRIIHDGQGITCQAEDITIKACANSICTQEYSGQVKVDFTSPSDGWSPDPVIFSGGSTTVDLSHTTAETVTLDAEATSPTADHPKRCFTYEGLETCQMVFKDVGILIDGQSSGGGMESDVITQIAGKRSNQGYNPKEQGIRVVKKDDQTSACIPGVKDKTLNVTFNYQVPEPNEGLDDNKIAIFDENNIELNEMENEGANELVQLHFDSNGKATFCFNSQDAGRYLLEAEIKIPVTNSTGQATGQYVAASDMSNDFVVRPLAVYANAVGNPNATNANDPRFKAAGEDFVLDFKSLQWTSDRDNNNDGEWDACGDATLSDPGSSYARVPEWNIGQPDVNLEKPVGGIEGNITYKNGNVLFDKGNHYVNATNVSYDEVGIIILQENGLSNFLGKQVNVCSPYIGRFVPHHFSLEVNSSGMLNATCANNFTYIGQNMTYFLEPKLNIWAENKANKLTKNYNGSFVHLEGSEVGINATEHDISKKGIDNKLLRINSWLYNGTIKNQGGLDGYVIYELSSQDKFYYIHNGGSKVSPFTSDILLNVTEVYDDKDSVNTPGSPPYATINPSGVEMRFGRLKIKNAYGSELINLPVDIRTEYYTGDNFETNKNDNCTKLSIINYPNHIPLELRGDSDSWKDADKLVSLIDNSTCQTQGTEIKGQSNGNDVCVDRGQATLILDAPGEGCTGYVYIRADLENFPWLQYDWNGNGTFTENPNATATFGIYKGNKHIIYQQETTWK